MPGDFLVVEIQTPCGSNPDGSTIYCSEIDYLKVPFQVRESEDQAWQDPDTKAIYRPLKNLVTALYKYGIEVNYDEDELVRRLGPPPESADQA